MKLIKLLPSEDKSLLTCHLCESKITRDMARYNGWAVDFPNERSEGDFYCLKCQAKLLDMH